MERKAGEPVEIGKIAVMTSLKAVSVLIIKDGDHIAIPITDAHAVADAIRLVATEAGVPDPTAALVARLVEALEKIDADWDGEPEDMCDARATLAAAREWRGK